MAKVESHKWEFKARFRRHAFGWKSQPPIQRIKEAISEIKKVARKDAVLAASGTVAFFERLSPALENVDSSSGAIGAAVNHAIAELVPIIGGAPADLKVRDEWLERLFAAHAADQIPYIERLADYWGELCGSKELASAWADRLLPITRTALSSDKSLRGHFHGTSACLSALFTAERHDEVIDLVKAELIWPYKCWAVKSLVAQGKKAEAIRYAEGCRNLSVSDHIDVVCEEILLSSGMVEDAYVRYGLTANRANTYSAWFRAVAKKYSHKKPAEILSALVAHTPGEEGKWFAAAKDAKLLDEAIALANKTPCSPQTLTRAARDFAIKNPDFAVKAGLAALRWLVEGYGYEITSADVFGAYSFTMKANENAGVANETQLQIRELVAKETFGKRFVTGVLGRQLGLV